MAWSLECASIASAEKDAQKEEDFESHGRRFCFTVTTSIAISTSLDRRRVFCCNDDETELKCAVLDALPPFDANEAEGFIDPWGAVASCKIGIQRCQDRFCGDDVIVSRDQRSYWKNGSYG